MFPLHFPLTEASARPFLWILPFNAHKRHYEKFADGTVKDIEDEIPFDVPEGWAWCRLKEVCTVFGRIGFRGYTRDDLVEKGNGAITLSPSNLINMKLDLTDCTYISWPKYEESPEIQLDINDVVVVKTGSSYGKTSLVDNLTEKTTLNPQLMVLKERKCNSKYLCYFLNTQYMRKHFEDLVNGTAIPTFSQEKFGMKLFPLPPQEEQERIVSAIEKVFKQINYLEQNKSDLQTAIKKTKSKILDLAIHGKLVPQAPNDEPAEELLKRIATSDNRPYKKFEEEEPYELPSNWSWCYLCDICSKIKRGKSPKYTDKSTIMAFAQKCNQKDGPTSLEKALYIDESTLKKYPEDEKMQFNDIVINSTGTGTLGRVGIFNCPIPDDVNAVYPDSHVTTVRILPEIDKLYCYYFIKNKQSYLETMGEGSTNQKELKPDTISSLCFPLPPYPEQQRIVAKIEELFILLDSISE